MPNERRELRSNRMMAHLLGALEMGQDIGPHGRHVFVSVARHFLPEDDIVTLLARNITPQEARALLQDGRADPPPRRGKVLEYMKRQKFPIIPDDKDAHMDDLYAGLNFPPEVAARIPKFQQGHSHEALNEPRDAGA